MNVIFEYLALLKQQRERSEKFGPEQGFKPSSIIVKMSLSIYIRMDSLVSFFPGTSIFLLN